MFKNTAFTAVDLSEASLAVARATAQEEDGIRNVEFRIHNLLDDNVRIGTFDVVDEYGRHSLFVRSVSRSAQSGEERRERRHRLHLPLRQAWLAGADASQAGGRTLLRHQVNFDRGVQMIKDLGFALDEYGWRYDDDDEATINGMIVDAFLNVNDILYDCDDIHDLMAQSGLHGYAIYGITTQDSGWFFDTSVDGPKGMFPPLAPLTSPNI